MKRFNVIAIFLILLKCTSSFGQGTYQYIQPKEDVEGWRTTHLSTLKVDTTLVFKLFSQIKQEEHKLHSALLVHNNQLVIEEYFNGHSQNEQHDLRSVTKSIRSILLGIAIDKGFIDDVNDPVLKYVKNQVPTRNLDTRKNSITIAHLLTMSTGLDCNDWDKKSEGQEDKVYKKKDWIQYTLNLPMVNDPGEVANYCSMGAILVAEIISQAAGITIDKFAEKYLFDPLEIENLSWGHTSKKEIIPSGKRLYMTSRDMAKIGQLVLNNGRWKDQTIVSDKWIKESTSAKSKITGIDYGYYWWSIPFKNKEDIIAATVATGNGGQYIMVLPSLDLVAVFTGGAYNSQDDKLPFAVVDKIFIPTFLSEKK